MYICQEFSWAGIERAELSGVEGQLKQQNINERVKPLIVYYNE